MREELLSWMKDVYRKGKKKEFEWKKIYPNNMPSNRVSGIYTDMFFKKDDGYMYLKYSIQYETRCDAEGLSHPEEGVKYYVLHELQINDLPEIFEIPEPSDEDKGLKLESYDLVVNDYGRYRYVFEDEETAKSVVSYQLLARIYPYLYILTDEELTAWEEFVKEYDVGVDEG